MNLYAPVVRQKNIRRFIAKASAQNLIIEEANVPNAYLYGDIDRAVVMEQPMNSPEKLEKHGFIRKHNKSLYGLRQAGEIWGDLIYNKILDWGVMPPTNDQRPYSYGDQASCINVVLAVDDMAFSSNDQILVDWFKENWEKAFKVRVLESLKSYIGWQLTKTDHGIHLGQSK